MGRIGLIAVLLILSAVQNTAANTATGIVWEVKQRFRVVSSADHDRFMALNKTYPGRAMAARGGDANGGPLTPYPSPFRELWSTAYDAGRHAYDHAWFHQKRRVIQVNVPSQSGRSCVWSIVSLDPTRASQIDHAESHDCATAVTLDADVGKHRLSVQVSGERSRRTLPIDIKDLKIAVLGDSFASGEGNPHVTVRTVGDVTGATAFRPAQWWDERCHRSLISSSAQAAIRMARDRKDTSVTYVSFACSGATVQEGILGRYVGVEMADQVDARFAGTGVIQYRDVDFYGKWRVRDKELSLRQIARIRTLTRLPPQFDMLRKLLCNDDACSAMVRPDFLIVMTGGNELKFSGKIRDCVTGRCSFTKASMKQAFEDLDKDYNDLAQKLSGLSARHTMIMTYPNMTRRDLSKTGYCNDAPFDFSRDFTPSFATALGFGIKRGEAQSADEQVLQPLNAKIVKLALAKGWHSVSGYRQDRGFCAPRTWFHTFDQSTKKQGVIFNRPDHNPAPSFVSTGAMHPNVFGHSAMADALMDVIAKLD